MLHFFLIIFLIFNVVSMGSKHFCCTIHKSGPFIRTIVFRYLNVQKEQVPETKEKVFKLLTQFICSLCILTICRVDNFPF